jgi:type VI secretion system secreted protein VgrG
MLRVMQITTPLGEGRLKFRSMTANEALGRLAEYRISALSDKDDIDPDKLLGKNVTVRLETAADEPRYFDAYVTRFGLAGYHGRHYRYEMVAHSWLWFLTRTTDCRIFQGKKVPDIVKEIFDKYPKASFEMKLSGSYEPWPYCVQYRETDFNFISRLLEQEGIYHYVKHADGKHTLVLSDSSGAHACCSGYETIPFLAKQQGVGLDYEYLTDWQFTKQIQPGKYALKDFDFEKPSVDLSVLAKLKRSHVEADHEYFDYPGEYNAAGEGSHFVDIRLEELQAQYEQAQGVTNARGMAVGHLFKLSGQNRSDQNREYLVCGAHTQLEMADDESSEQQGAHYQCGFSVIPSSQPFRPQRQTPKPIVQGPQTAIVVGPKGDEIYVDKYGRVKVQFHWDRYGKRDENSSCWVRVAQHWAGKNWGMIAHPRIGQEVIVDFLEGDPDQPIITGRVYNAEQMPPYDLPGSATQSGIKSRSSKGGSPANFNEIRFEDKAGSEQVYIHAEKNQDNIVENDETTNVGHDRTESVKNNEKIRIGVDRTENVGNNETIGIGVDRTETVGSNETISVGANRSVTVGASETKKVALQRTHLVGVNETIGVGAAQEIAIGAFQAIVVGAYQTTNVGGYQSNNIGAAQTNTIGAAQTNSIGAAQNTTVGAARSVKVGAAQTVNVAANASMSVGGDESRSVTGGRSSSIGKDDALKVAKNMVIDAGESVTIKTGSASITMKKDGTITIKGKDITVNGSGKINVKADGDIVMKGSKIEQN